ncbi:TFIIE alpha subunit [Nitzschia inconspicua]|uniref:TFIIE alpha subunit n=1 Tax=Nitzschia inconspicua TaxID=303405 RepID=A0A9K3PYX2_9STRA|nr:TFIIE alpha subunit [Nitzschia inconspicua]
MSDLTVYAEALIATVARAFYEDDAVCLIDVLIRDKFLRDDDMAPRLKLPAKKLRAILQFLQEEHLVKSEEVDDLAQGGSQATKFWYIDYNHAVHTIRLRLHLLRKELEEAELSARSSSFYLCPGYKTRRCNGRYTEEEAQQIVDPESGLFLCQECFLNFENDPVMSQKKEDYALQLVDNAKDLKLAVDNIRRVNVQLSAKMVGSQQLRAGVYDLLQKVRGKGKDPITSNLPSENFTLGRGSKRLAGTGRTAGIKARKLEQQGVAGSSLAAKNILVGAASARKGGVGDENFSDLTFLKNALGNEIAFAVEKGGGARANLLSQRHPNPNRKRQKLMDAAATRIATKLLLDDALPLKKRKLDDDKNKPDDDPATKDPKKTKKTNGLPGTENMDWLSNNISREGLDMELDRLRRQDMEEEDSGDLDATNRDDLSDGLPSDAILLSDPSVEKEAQLDEDARKATFLALYAKEMNRQAELMQLENEAVFLSSPPKGFLSNSDDKSLSWEDG